MKRRRSYLFMPGNNPAMLAASQHLGADAVIFDLEDAVAQAEKDAARALVRHALVFLHKRSAEIVVRINALDTPHWKADIHAAVMGGADGVLAPKCAAREDILTVAACLEATETAYGRSEETRLLALVESSLGIENAFGIASAHPRLMGMLLGAEDLTAELGARRTPEGREIFYARSRILMACKAAGIPAIDTPFPFVSDLDGLAKDAAFAAQMGFDAKALISPQHVHMVNEAFTPAPDQVHWALRVIAVALRAKLEGKGAVALDGMMIDLPVIKRAEHILLLAGEIPEAVKYA